MSRTAGVRCAAPPFRAERWPRPGGWGNAGHICGTRSGHRLR